MDNTVWKLHLSTMKWSNIGVINGISKNDILVCNLLSKKDNKFYILTDVFNEIDLKKNILKKYEKMLFSTNSCYLEGNNFICILPNEIKKTKFF